METKIKNIKIKYQNISEKFHFISENKLLIINE